MRSKIITILNFFGIKEIAKNFYITFIYYTSINGIKQSFNYKKIPIIIISFNQLFYLRKLVRFLQRKKYLNIIIIDNNSTYPPLLEYLKSISGQATVYMLDKNYGHLVFWKNRDIFKKYMRGYYVITDADIVPESYCPDDFLLEFKKILNKNRKVSKVGFSLKIDDLPAKNTNREKVIRWESQFWKNINIDGNYQAPIDTTFALYKPGFIEYNSKVFYNAIRTKNPYVAIHGGWYIDSQNPTDEQKYYLKVARHSASWLTDENGDLLNKMYQ
ncbi:glycosyltransferase [Flavobacterium sp. TMP13]|uniref:glycosyltransferase n=1 Tax=Flavobacterium sp. TMP13 TaxID=3425950 RepID=UPI003D78A5DC